MKISKQWLDRFFPTLAEGEVGTPALAGVGVDKIAEALTFHAFEIDGIEKVGDDEVLDVKVTPSRGHDCLSHRGIAKELSAILKVPLAHDPLATPAVLAPISTDVSVSMQRSDLCKRYVAGHIKGVTVGPSPDWLKARLEAIGQRSINNVVDATNFVMFNLGQPLHAFDAGKLGSLALGVRLAKAGERLVTLDKKEYELSGTMLVITAADKPVGIAGVKGGMPAGIDESTQTIVIESANFDSVSIRKSAQMLKLRTDASTRFEQGLSPELAAWGMQAVAALIVELAGGEVVGFVDAYPESQRSMHASVTVEKINQVLGTSLTGADVADVFTRLGFNYKPARPDDSGRSGGEEGGVFEVQVPPERLDIAIPEDLVEEVGRIVGYDKVPATALPKFDKTPTVNQNFYAAEQARERLVAQGYSEVYTSVFSERGERAVQNKIGGEKPYLRDSLLPGLQEALNKNKPNKDLLGLKEVKLFEIGAVWKGGKEIVMIGTISEKEEATEAQPKPVEATAYDTLPLSQTERYQIFSKYPYIVRDIAMWVPAGTDENTVLTQIKQEADELAHKAYLFDRFEKEGKVSLAYRIIFQSFERTLTEAEVGEIMLKIQGFLGKKGFEIR